MNSIWKFLKKYLMCWQKQRRDNQGKHLSWDHGQVWYGCLLEHSVWELGSKWSSLSFDSRGKRLSLLCHSGMLKCWKCVMPHIMSIKHFNEKINLDGKLAVPPWEEQLHMDRPTGPANSPLQRGEVFVLVMSHLWRFFATQIQPKTNQANRFSTPKRFHLVLVEVSQREANIRIKIQIQIQLKHWPTNRANKFSLQRGEAFILYL